MIMHTSARNTVAYGAIVSTILYPVSIVIGFAWNVVLTRALSPSEVGVYAVGMTVLGIVSIVCNFGMASGVNRFLPILEERGDIAGERYVLWLGLLSPFIMSCSVGLCLYAARGLLGAWFGKELKYVLLFVIVAIPFHAVLATVYKAFIARRAPITSQLLSFTTMKLIPMVLVLVLVGFGMRGTAYQVMRLVMISIVMMTIVGVGLVHFRVVDLFGTVRGRGVMMGEILKYTLPLTFVGMFSMMTLWMDTLMLGMLSTSENIAYYNMAYLMAALVTTLAFMLPQTLLMPVMMRKYALDDVKGIQNAYGGVARTGFILAIPIACCLLFLGPSILELAFGSAYVAGSGSLRILALLLLMSAAFGHSSTVVSVLGQSRWILLVSVVALAANAVGNIIMIPRFGIIGAAIATGGAGLLAAAMMFIKLPRGFAEELPTLKMLLLLVYGFIIFAVLSLVPCTEWWLLCVIVLMGMLLYVGMGWCFGGILKGDKAVYVSILGDAKRSCQSMGRSLQHRIGIVRS